ncbi:protein kinase domain-containing protein [Bacillus pumilus]|uniref:protein kinase domain-containing protein n=1 Tax=Bacillus pumilus TaxID=1408 RepID=UPI0011A36129|nr:protein kinase [Bacillus pumilus]
MYKIGDLVYEKVQKKPIGSGGNARVFKAKKSTGEILALKELKTGDRNFNKKRERFNSEIQIVREIQSELSGIIPVIDFALPDEEGKYWYTMPLALPLNEKLPKVIGVEKIEEIANCIIQLAEVMSDIHQKDIVHRDIKPSNIYWYNEQFCFGDFGLVDYPDKENLTATRESVGPRNTIAPEMKNDAKNSDGKKADVYSLAKTLWMLLTGSFYGFEGTYDESSKRMGLNYFFPKQHLVELNSLLYDSTREEPELRPSMNEFSERLKEWLSIRADFQKSNLSQWSYIQNKLFKNYVPDSATWTDINDIVSVLNLLGTMPGLNHMFLPGGGGLDLNSVSLAIEEGCIEINAQALYIGKPKKLIVENIDKDYIWSYFRLELETINPIFEISPNYSYEMLTDDLSGEYFPWICANYGYYEDGKPLPKGYKMVNRYLKGDFVMFSKASIYNQINSTYDGRHNDANAEIFRQYIKLLRQSFLKLPKNEFLDYVSENPFKEEEDLLPNNWEEEIEKENKLHSFIESILDSLNLKEILVSNPENNGEIEYTFKYTLKDDKLFSLKQTYFILNDGSLSPLKKDLARQYKLYSEIEAKEFIKKCNEFLKSQALTGDVEWVEDPISSISFKVEGRKLNKPIHLFTKDELKSLLIKGNDAVSNTVVVSTDGNVKLLENRNFSDFDFINYPVRLETFQSYNNYVGKYSRLNHLEETYIMLLQGWKRYLKNGGRIFINYISDPSDENTLIDEIKFYY